MRDGDPDWNSNLIQETQMDKASARTHKSGAPGPVPGMHGICAFWILLPALRASLKDAPPLSSRLPNPLTPRSPCSPRDSEKSSPTPQFKSINSSPERNRMSGSAVMSSGRGHFLWEKSERTGGEPPPWPSLSLFPRRTQISTSCPRHCSGDSMIAAWSPWMDCS